MEDKQLVAAARRAGIVDSFINMTDDVETVSDNTRAALLAAMGRDPADMPEITPVPPVKVFTQGKKVLLTPEGSGAFQWQLTQENGSQTHGDIPAGQALNLGAALPAGYHQLTLSQNGNVFAGLSSRRRVAMSRRRCGRAKNCGARRCSFIPCVRKITGAWVISVT